MKSYEIFDFSDVGYQKLFHHQSWRVAMLNYIEELEIEHINYVESHSLTDEVFVLLHGECYMIFATVEENKINQFECVKLEPHKVYKIHKGVYHAHVLTRDAKLLIIEEENTHYENSPRIYLDEEEVKAMKKTYMESKDEL